MKSVLISINPKWCFEIIKLVKTLEIRKNKPNLDVPFKVYIYCTKSVDKSLINAGFNLEFYGAIIAEFICDKIVPIHVLKNGYIQDWNENQLDHSCVPYDDMVNYIGLGKTGYGWHISNLKIYDKPKTIKDFNKPFPFHSTCMKCERGKNGFNQEDCYGCKYFESFNITKAPQSWCYVESLYGE